MQESSKDSASHFLAVSAVSPLLLSAPVLTGGCEEIKQELETCFRTWEICTQTSVATHLLCASASWPGSYSTAFKEELSELAYAMCFKWYVTQQVLSEGCGVTTTEPYSPRGC